MLSICDQTLAVLSFQKESPTITHQTDNISQEELSRTYVRTRVPDSSISDMVHISYHRLPCPVHAVVSSSHAHSFPVARKASGVGLVPPHQLIPHAASPLLIGLLELPSPVSKWKKTSFYSSGKIHNKFHF